MKRYSIDTLGRPRERAAERVSGRRLKWDIAHLHEHLQGAVDLELWTIPYYLTVMYSIRDPSCAPYRLCQAAVFQEMLHTQLASNICNAYGYSPTFEAPVYKGDVVPHINFDLDDPNPTEIFTPYCAELGALDEERINTMCLIEYPEWATERQPDLRQDVYEYGSIGEFYDAILVGMRELREHLSGGLKQVDYFGDFYQNAPQLTITKSGEQGYSQAVRLVNIITDQGEGQTEGDADVPPQYRNTADGFMESWPHFRKFMSIREMNRRPATYRGVPNPEPDSPGYEAQQRLIKDFDSFLQTLNSLFGKGEPGAFGARMAKIGGDVLACWQAGAIPRFS